ncbi:hypothetical protein VPH35_095695 [Triticum aestivum]
MASWADLPLDPLDLVVAGLANPADRARSRAVCRSWHSAVRRHGPQTAQLPWIVFFYGQVTSVPRNADLSGSANEWLLFGIYYRTPKLIDNYVLHNIFSGERVSLTELDATLHRAYRISKFQMRSTAHDFMAVVTTNENHPLIVILSGKGVWLPEPRAVPYVYIVNIAFCGDKLYGISKAEDLIPFDLGLDEDGRPMVTIGRHVIRRPLDYYGWDDDYNDDDEDDEDDEDDDVGGEDEEEVDIDVAADDEDEDEEKMKEAEAVHTHILPDYSLSIRKVDVFMADVSACKWVPMAHGLDGGRALFVGQNFSKFLSAPCGDIKEDAIYFIESGEVKAQTQNANPARFREPCYWGRCGVWLFPPELVL